MDIQIETIDDAPQAVTTVATTQNPSEHLAIAERFNIQLATKEENEKLSTIWGYVKAKGGEREMSDVIWDVINLELQLGSPKLGESRLDRLYKYVKLRMGEARIQAELKDVSNSTNIH